MRALTVRQPWAWAICHAGKDVENRTRSLGPYRGLVAIHAGQRYDPDGFETVTRLAGRTPPEPGFPRSPMLYGYVVGVAHLASVHTAGECGGRCSPWAEPTGFHLRLPVARPLEDPVPADGALGLWRPDPDLTAQIRRQLTPAELSMVEGAA